MGSRGRTCKILQIIVKMIKTLESNIANNGGTQITGVSNSIITGFSDSEPIQLGFPHKKPSLFFTIR